jgi:hypothetical protein
MLASLLLVTAAALLPQATPTQAQRFAAGRPPPGLESGLAWDALLARDARAGFAPQTGRAALEYLLSAEGASAPAEERAVAFVALGVSEMRGERARLEAATSEGGELERRAATLALGRLGPGSTALLLSLADQTEPVQAECALLALLYSGQPDARARVEARAASDARVAALLAFLREPYGASESAAGRLWLELRFAAAKRYGLIDGRSWRIVLLEALAKERAFLDRLVYRTARRLHRPGVPDHFLGALFEDSGEEALRAAVAMLPNELALVIENGLWTPTDEQWPIVLDEIGVRRIESLAEPLLRRALERSDVGGLAALLLVRAGDPGGRATLEAALASSGPELRRRTAESLGDSGQATWLGWLSALRDDADPSVRAAALVAQLQLGHAGARKNLAILLANPELAERESPVPLLVAALARAAETKIVAEVLEESLPSLQGDVRLDAACALALQGRSSGTIVLRQELSARPPAGARGARMVRALGRFPDNSDVQLLLERFPQEDEVDVNTALAEVLLAARTPLIGRFLRAAMWQPPFHRGMLAAALLVELAGIDALRQEVETPQMAARPEDLRRVGFALGAWGGLVQVEVLAARVPVGDPALQGAVLGALGARTH